MPTTAKSNDGYEVFLQKEYRNSMAALERLLAVQEQVLSCPENRIFVNIVDTSYITPVFLILVATLPELGDIVSKKIILRYNKSRKLYHTLSEHGVLQYYHVSTVKTSNHTIPLCKIESLEQSSQLVNQILDLAPIEMTAQAKDTIFSKLYEIFINADTHGKNATGTFCHGFLNSTQKGFTFSIYDFGIGIQKNVNNFLKRDLSSLDTMKWAMQEGNSTSVTDYPRGAGFTLLEKFVTLNNGKMWLCSDSVLCRIENGQKKYKVLEHRIKGTLFIMNIKADAEYIYTVK